MSTLIDIPVLSAQDHTAILQLVIRHSESLSLNGGSLDAFAVLKQLADAELGDRDLLRRTLSVIRITHESVERQRKNQADPVYLHAARVTAMAVASRSVWEAIDRLCLERKSTQPHAVAIGIQTALDILEDGAPTIYSPGFWIVEQVIPYPGVRDEQLIQGFKDIADAAVAAGEKAAGVVGADLAGAIEGAVAGFAEGAFQGAAAGAAGHAIESSVEAAVE